LVLKKFSPPEENMFLISSQKQARM